MEISQKYPCNPANYSRGRAGPIQYIVIHYVGATGGAENNAKYYSRSKVESSAHYFVGHAAEGAAVYQSVQDKDTAWHCGRSDGKYVHPECRNANSIGIEICCHQDKSGAWYFDPETVDKAVELTRTLMDKHRVDASRVIRHYDVTGKLCPRPFVDNLPAWVKFKSRLVEEMTQEQFDIMFNAAMGKYLTRLSALPASTWAQESWDKANVIGIMDGKSPGGHLTREQLATVLNRLNLLS